MIVLELVSLGDRNMVTEEEGMLFMLSQGRGTNAKAHISGYCGLCDGGGGAGAGGSSGVIWSKFLSKLVSKKLANLSSE